MEGGQTDQLYQPPQLLSFSVVAHKCIQPRLASKQVQMSTCIIHSALVLTSDPCQRRTMKHCRQSLSMTQGKAVVN